MIAIKSLRTKIIFVTVSLLILGMSLIAFGNIYLFRGYYIELDRNKSIILGKFLREELTTIIDLGIPIDQIAGFNERCRLLVDKNQNIVYAAVFNIKGEIIYHSDPSQVGKIIDCWDLHRHKSWQLKSYLCNTHGINHSEIVMPVFDSQNGNLGGVIIEDNLTEAKRVMSHMGMFSLLLAGVMVIVTILLGVFVLNQWVIVSLNKLIKAAREIAAGKIEHQIEVSSQDEIGDLAKAFNVMIKELKKTLDELQEIKDKLGFDVDVKTKTIVEEKNKLLQANAEMSRERTAIVNILEDINETNNNLRNTQERLVQTAKMASIGQLAAGLAHEINNPLTGVLNNVQLIKMSMEEDGNSRMSEAELKDIFDVIEESALRCKNITQALLDFSHISKTFVQGLSLNETIQKVCNLVGYELKLQNIIIEKELESNLPPIYGNSQLLQQVFMNLITNARWAIRKKEEKKNGKIMVRTGYDSGRQLIYVYFIDNGIGMSEDTQKRIFEPFFTTKDVGEGTGLGLSIIYGIVKEHKGTVEVESKENVGTTFKLYFPLSGQTI